MKRSAFALALLLFATAASPLAAAGSNYSSIVTRKGQTFYDCKVVRVHPDGVAFTHRDGAAKIPFKDLPEKIRQEHRYDPVAEARYQREQAALRQQEKERERVREAVMQEKLMEAQMAEASYLAAANRVYQPAPAPMATSLPGEPMQVAYQTPSWVGTPIGTTTLGGHTYRRSYYSGQGFYPYGYGYGYPTTGYIYPAYNYPNYGYPACSYPAYTYPNYGGYASPRVYGSWNVGNGIRVGVGLGGFGGGIRVFR